MEDMILNRLISGIHTSINCHIGINFIDQNNTSF